MKRTTLSLLALIVSLQPSFGAEAPYEPGLQRLAEILGSLHFLRNLCASEGQAWREEMEKLIAADKPDDARKARMIASFNHGYRSFQTTYSSCTPAALESISRYMKEGEGLAREIYGRYGN